MVMKLQMIEDGVDGPLLDITNPDDFIFGFDEPPLDGYTVEAGVAVTARLISDETAPFTTSAPAVDVQPQFLGQVIEGFDVEIQPAIYTGTPGAQVTTLLELNGATVTLPESNIYSVPDGTSGQALDYSESAGNNVVDGVGDPILATPSVSTTVLAAVAPAADTAPTIAGDTPGFTVTISPGTFTGTPDPTVTGVLTLDSVDVTADMDGLDYTIPTGTDGQVLEYTQTASTTGFADATQSVSVTVEALATGLVAAGGTTTDIGSVRRHDYTADGTFTVTTGGDVEYEIVAGGGASGDADSSAGGASGAGAGGDVLRGTLTLSPGTYDIVVGAAGLAEDTAVSGLPEGGGNTIIFDGEAFAVTAIGGGPGGSRAPNSDPANGGGGYGGDGSLSGAVHPTSFSGGDGVSSYFANPELRNGGGGRGARGNGTDGSESGPGLGGPGAISEAPGISATYGKGGDASAADNGAVDDATGFGNGADGCHSEGKYASWRSEDGENGAPGIVHFWYGI